MPVNFITVVERAFAHHQSAPFAPTHSYCSSTYSTHPTCMISNVESVTPFSNTRTKNLLEFSRRIWPRRHCIVIDIEITHCLLLLRLLLFTMVVITMHVMFVLALRVVVVMLAIRLFKMRWRSGGFLPLISDAQITYDAPKIGIWCPSSLWYRILRWN